MNEATAVLEGCFAKKFFVVACVATFFIEPLTQFGDGRNKKSLPDEKKSAQSLGSRSAELIQL